MRRSLVLWAMVAVLLAACPPSVGVAGAPTSDVGIWNPYGNVDPEHVNVLAILGFSPPETGTTDSTELLVFLDGKSTIIIPAQQTTSSTVEGLERVGAELAPVLRDFLSAGGRIVGMTYARGAEDILRGAGFWPCYDYGELTGSSLGVVAGANPLLSGVPTVFEAPDGSTDFAGVPADAEVLVRGLSGTHPAAFKWDVQSGSIVMLGFDYYDYNCATATLLCNAVGVEVRPEVAAECERLQCFLCDGRVYAYGTWCLQYLEDREELLVATEDGALGFIFRMESNGWFEVVVDGATSLVSSGGGVTAEEGGGLSPIEELAADRVGPIPENPLTVGNWRLSFGSEGLTLANSSDVASDSYQGLTIKKNAPRATFHGRITTAEFGWEPEPCQICDGQVYTYGAWRLAYLEEDLFVVDSTGSLEFDLWSESNGWFELIDNGAGYTVWSWGEATTDDYVLFASRASSILAAAPVGPVPETLSVVGEWQLTFAADGLTLANNDDIGVGAYAGLHMDKDGPQATFQGHDSATAFPQPRTLQSTSCVCETLYTDVSADEVDSILDELGLEYLRQDLIGVSVWFVVLEDQGAALYPFLDSETSGGRYAGLQLYYYASGIAATAADINRWNSESRGTRAYIDSEGDPTLRADLYFEGGVPLDAVGKFITRFGGYIQDFLTFLNGAQD